MKIGFDVHGVLDTFEQFRTILKKCIVDPDIEVHIITGLRRIDLEKEISNLIDLSSVDHIFSITDFLLETNVEVSWVDGKPWADKEKWNIAKSVYCAQNQIDILFDDSPTYAMYFDDIDTIYCQIHNPNRKLYKTR